MDRPCGGSLPSRNTGQIPDPRTHERSQPRLRTPWPGPCTQMVQFCAVVVAEQTLSSPHERALRRVGCCWPRLCGEQLPVPLGDDLDGAVAHLDGRLVVNCVRRAGGHHQTRLGVCRPRIRYGPLEAHRSGRSESPAATRPTKRHWRSGAPLFLSRLMEAAVFRVSGCLRPRTRVWASRTCSNAIPASSTRPCAASTLAIS